MTQLTNRYPNSSRVQALLESLLDNLKQLSKSEMENLTQSPFFQVYIIISATVAYLNRASLQSQIQW